ncbi:MAG: peroxide stress protein YaaA [Acidobacteriota bacterium]|nr:peroxide stress protein YaaA [Acidobacteriota bacterium]
MNKSHILIVTVCSNQKVQGEYDYDKEAPSISKVISFNIAGELIRRRLRVLEIIKSGSLSRDGLNLKEMQFNARLFPGPDFGGRSAKPGIYMSAASRYAGRFYTAVKEKNDRILEEAPHHILIISALYGMLLPEELIQVYSCDIEDHPDITAIWAKDEFLTSIMLSYIGQFEIVRLFDLTGQEAYRSLLNWDRISSKVEVLHVFGEQYAGATILSTLGELARDHILGNEESKIRLIEPEKVFFLERDKVLLTNKPFPPAGYPKDEPKKKKNELSENKRSQEFQKEPLIKSQEIVLLDYPRDIRITSKGDNTIFERRIENINDLPPEMRQVIREFSRCPDVLEVFFEKRMLEGSSSSKFRFRLLVPVEGCGYISARIIGPGKVCHSQDVSIRVTRNRENQVFEILKKILE